MPVWHNAANKWVAEGRLQILGVIQEQHADRCRLFAQWKKFDWPIVQDPINVLQTAAVPIVLALDEHGIVRSTRPRPETFEKDFLDRTYKDDASNQKDVLTPPRNLPALKIAAKVKKTAVDWRRYADALALWGGTQQTNAAIDAYQRAIEMNAEENKQGGDAHFRRGVCLRRRWESGQRQMGDFQQAVQAWEAALATNPNQYIWRRRIQQYGPRLIKPYPFYDWVTQAESEIRDRGQTPIVLTTRPSGAEIAQPQRRGKPERREVEEKTSSVAVSPDPHGKIHRDDGLIQLHSTVAPSTIEPGGAVRVHLAFFPNTTRRAHWNNEAEPLRIWIDPPDQWRTDRRLVTVPYQPEKTNSQQTTPKTDPISHEVRRVEFEVHAPRKASVGIAEVKGYALYYACEDVHGQCVFLRRDFTLKIRVQ